MSGDDRVASVRLRHGGGRLPQPVSSSALRWTERHGLLLELRTADGRLGIGEASPLPGYSSDTLEECEAALSRLDAGAFEGLALDGCGAPELRSWLADHPLPPAARFAAETALIDLAGRISESAASALLGSPVAPHPVPLAALLSGEDLEKAAADPLARGLRTLKVKIGAPGEFAQGFERELAALQRLRSSIGSGVQLRLDANGAFTCEEAPARLEALASLEPEQIEEPVPLGQLAAFALHHASPIPLAADESLRVLQRRAELLQAFANGRIAVAVLKPTVLGGALACLDLVAELLPLGARFVVTHAFEGPVALGAARVLASVLPVPLAGPVPAAGLDAHAALAAWGQS